MVSVELIGKKRDGATDFISVDSQDGKLLIDLDTPCTFQIVGLGKLGLRKEYFLKVTERKGLVLV